MIRPYLASLDDTNQCHLIGRLSSVPARRVQVPVVTSRLSRVPIFRVCLLPLSCYTTNQSALSYSYPYPALSLRAKMMLRALSAPRLHWAASRSYATVSNPQTLVEKIVQKYAVDLPAGSKVRSGDYVMIRPEHV